MARYFTKVTHCNAAKNKLELGIINHFKALECHILEDERQKDEFIKDIEVKVDNLYKLNPRCKMVVLDIFKSDEHTQIHTSGDFTVLTIYLSKN
jgi:hypothetical protein